jgi:thymidylate synthase ThyX
MTKINAKIIKHSKCPRGNELVTFELVFPRFILAELNVHRMFSKNSASSRAIPFKKMVEMVKNDPFIPSAWQKEHKGMQGSEYITERGIIELRNIQWLNASKHAINSAKELNNNCQSSTYDGEIEDSGVTKQLCNRLLEPFMWHKVLLTTGKEGLSNFFELRNSLYEINEEELDKLR